MDDIGVDVLAVYGAVLRAAGDNEQTWVLVERVLKTFFNEETKNMDEMAIQARFSCNPIYHSLLKGQT